MKPSWKLIAAAAVLWPAVANAQTTWEKRAPLLEPNSETAVTQMGGKLFVIGGYPSTRITVDTVQVYDSKTDKWSFVARLPQPINHAMTAVVDGRLYVIGGQLTAGGRGRAAGYVNTNLVYDVGDDRWLGRARMPTSRSAGMAAVLDGKIYVAGGRPPRGSDFAVYDPKTDSWETLPDLPTQRNHMVAVALDGKIFVVGGREGGGFRSPQIDAVEAFDPETGKWERKAPLLEPRSGLNGIVHKGCLHVFGGEGLEGTNQDGVHTEHDVYNPKTGKWTQLPPMPIPIHGVVGMASFGDWIHLPGGGIRQGGSSGTTLHQVVKADIGCG